MLAQGYQADLRDINEFLTNEIQAQSLVGFMLENRVVTLEKELLQLQDSTQAWHPLGMLQQARMHDDYQGGLLYVCYRTLHTATTDSWPS